MSTLNALCGNMLVINFNESLFNNLPWLRDAGIVTLSDCAVSLGGLITSTVIKLLNHRSLVLEPTGVHLNLTEDFVVYASLSILAHEI